MGGGASTSRNDDGGAGYTPYADEAYAKEAARRNTTPGDAWAEAEAAWWAEATKDGRRVTKRAVLERCNPAKVKDAEGSQTFRDLQASVDAAAAETGGDPSWWESTVLGLNRWWAGVEDTTEYLSFQVKSLIWGKTKQGVNGYVLAWLDFARAHPLPAAEIPGPDAGVPDAAPAATWSDPGAGDAGPHPDGSQGPGDQIVFTGFQTVYNVLRASVKNFGKGNDDAQAPWERKGALGSQMFNGSVWPEVDPHRIMLGQTQENHAFFRPVITRMVGHNGLWTQAQVEAHCDALFASHRPLHGTSLKEWGTLLLHKVHLDLDLSAEDARAFIAMQTKIMVPAALSQDQIDSWLVRQTLALGGASPDQVNAFKRVWLARYVDALLKHPTFAAEAAGWTDAQRMLVASGCFDSLMLAGGLSVPTVVMLVVAVAANPACVGLPDGWAVTDANAAGLVWEICRFFAPVGGFNIWEKPSHGGRHFQLQLACSQFDPRAWGGDAGTFNPGRSLADFHKYGRIAWAHPAIGGDDPDSTADADWGAPNAHACPGMDLSFKWCVAFAKKFAAVASNYEVGKGKTAADVSVNGYGSSDPTLVRKDSINAAGTFDVTVVKCSGLRDADWVGTSDPYVVARVGARGSSWGDNAAREAKTKTVQDSQNPSYGEALSLAYDAATAQKGAEQLELQLGVFDSDDWNVLGDDSLGRCTIVVGWDALDGGGERAYPLKGGGDGATITLSWKRTPAATA